MNLVLIFSLFVAAYAHGDCGGDCLKACQSCRPVLNDGAEWENGTSPFWEGPRIVGDCWQAVCKEKGSVLIVDGHQYDRLVCFQGKWHFGYPNFLEETESAMCLAPGNMTCDEDATVKYYEENFKCVCNAPYKDVSEDFESEEPICSNCPNKKLNIVLLIDNSGSTQDVLPTIKKFIAILFKFLDPQNDKKSDGNRVALVTSAFSYDILFNFDEEAVAAQILMAVSLITADGQSYLGSGMEAVKAAIVQPEHVNDSGEHKLIVFTDGSVKHSPPKINDIIVAANNLEALGVETFVVATNTVYNNTQIAIANGVVANVFGVDPEKDLFPIVNKLQKKVCA